MDRKFRHRSLYLAAAMVFSGSIASQVFGYGFYQYGNGRADFATRYDVAGNMYPGQSNATFFNFGTVADFSAADRAQGDFPAFFTAANVQAALNQGAADWEKWINVAFDIPLGASGAGNLQLFFDTGGTGAYVWGYQAPHGPPNPHPGTFNYTSMHFGATAAGGVAWNATNFNWTVKHELGHVLGLDDMYAYPNNPRPLPEDFVDHVVAGNPNPQREIPSLTDNLMYQYNNTNNYAGNPNTVIDNDEIAGASWLWGSKYNQIVTGDLEGAWNGLNRRGSREHHGDNQPGQGAGVWDYRVSFSTNSGSTKPYVDLDFQGYQGFTATTFPGGPGVTETDLGGDIHRFTVDQAGYQGNLVLNVTSSFTQERRIRAWVATGNRKDNFVLPVDTAGLTYDNKDNWAVVFGPMGNQIHQDFGDLPDSYHTTMTADGPRYTDGIGQRIGALWDAEPDGQPTPRANGDDLNQSGYGNNPSDEDGIVFGHDSVTITLSVDHTGDQYYSLRAWWDVNGNGEFDHPTEMFINSELYLPDIRTETFTYQLGFDPWLYPARFRFTWLDAALSNADGLKFGANIEPYGEYISADLISHGEVQDYVPEPATLSLAMPCVLLLARRRRRRV